MTTLKHASFRFKAGEVLEDGTFTGYGSVFHVVDQVGDVVLPGAFQLSLEAHAASASMPALLWQHKPEEPLGIYSAMSEDEHGLAVKGKLLPEVARAREALALLRAGAMNGLSIGFEIRQSRDITAAEAEAMGIVVPETFSKVRLLSEIDLWEVSLVTFPACDPARVEAVRAARRTAAPQPRPQTHAKTNPAAPDLVHLARSLSRRGALLRGVGRTA